MSKEGEQFLHKQDSKLHNTEAVLFEQAQRERADEEVHSKPADKIADWMEVLEQTHGHGDPQVLDRIKQSYHRQYVINPEDVPESTYELEARIARQLGHGDVPITDEYRKAKAREIISNQEDSLDRWVDYLTSEDATCPMWAKYWAFTAVTKMGKFEKKITQDNEGNEQESARFANRTSDTVAAFPPLNPRALALAVSAIIAKAEQRGIPKSEREPVENTSTKLDDAQFQQLLSSESFAKLYTQYLIELPAYSAEGLRETRGAWTKYDRYSDAKPLVDSLEGHPLEWCTAGIDTARTQLTKGDFYVYYSLDEDSNPTIPRVAIRMERDSIAEVRGIAPNQNLDPYIGEVVEDKMTEFPDGEDYKKRSSDMQLLTAIDERMAQGQEPTVEDLRFLYEIDAPIMDFGYNDDPRIKALLQDREERSDLAKVFDCEPSQISFDVREALSGTAELPIVYYAGSIDERDVPYKLESDGELRFPQRMDGSLTLRKPTSAEGLILPLSVGGSLELDSLVNADGLTLPVSVYYDLSMFNATSVNGLTMPESVGGGIVMTQVKSIDGLVFPKSVGGHLDLHDVKTAQNVTLPEQLGGDLILTSLVSADGLVLPKSVSTLVLNELAPYESMVWPETGIDRVRIRGLQSDELNQFFEGRGYRYKGDGYYLKQS